MLIPDPHFDISHPDMDIFINTDKSPALIQAKASGSPLSGFKVKREAVVPQRVTVLRHTDRHRSAV